MKNSKFLVAAAVGGAAFLAYKKGLFSKLFAKASPEPKNDGPRVPGNPLNDPFSFQSKVAKIQNYLGAAIDGIPGPQTNRLLAAKYGLPYGNVSLDNVDKYLKDLKLWGI
jgi:hypothetical protein